MPSLKAFADIIRDWTLLLEAGQRSPEVAAGIETERQGLAKALEEVQVLKGRQDELTALRQQVTQELKAAVTHGKDAAIQFRAAVKAKFGPRTERLVHFKMAPIRKRSRKRAEVEKPPVDGEGAGAEPTSPAVKPA